eukprot:TRINITY_DN41457_c0_g1_i1.p1 TRINITY_DN41457_c0_g1~~TRINITY_DN41457_c0_g1_i1.p1  ORF type:complete len:109 (-),score=5.65 TRINITY_DN41457_c0_g1_i1:150-476(-)
MIRRPPRSTLSSSSAASDVYKRQELGTYFLFACSSLRNGLDLAPLCNVVSIGTFFLFNTYPSPMRGKIVNADMMMESLDVESKRNVQFLENTVSSSCLLYTSPSPRDS